MIHYPSRALMIPPATAGAEIGVAEGEFSAEILARGVTRLYLVDAWKHLGGSYEKDLSNVSDGGHEARHRRVRERFAGDARVCILRMLSTKAAECVADAGLDWVYIDADHGYDGCLADLQAWAGKVKAGGAIFGHDYVADAVQGFGVIEAVDTFCREAGWGLAGMSDERWPSYELRRVR